MVNNHMFVEVGIRDHSYSCNCIKCTHHTEYMPMTIEESLREQNPNFNFMFEMKKNERDLSKFTGVIIKRNVRYIKNKETGKLEKEFYTVDYNKW